VAGLPLQCQWTRGLAGRIQLPRAFGNDAGANGGEHHVLPGQSCMITGGCPSKTSTNCLWWCLVGTDYIQVESLGLRLCLTRLALLSNQITYHYEGLKAIVHQAVWQGAGTVYDFHVARAGELRASPWVLSAAGHLCSAACPHRLDIHRTINVRQSSACGQHCGPNWGRTSCRGGFSYPQRARRMSPPSAISHAMWLDISHSIT
jgi:hypothetical protein